ncbi:MFS transporter [Caproiciproducens sp. NJN-50]|uniref:MFS transporter n=1 Tax=Acutalibacteraceae TaxID=3082771 RepID=UPI000FFE1C4C|nr:MULTISPECIES: MFS transporter [Acutalibacteraceae]QAT48948.1 MFS transporter [Caproiciproducens sp. NJN-50]
MKAKKYLWVLATVYLAYFTQGIQALVLSQNKVSFYTQWGFTNADAGAAAVSAAIAFTGLGKFVSVWVCGEISDRIGRKPMVFVGALAYVLSFLGLLVTSNVVVANVCAFGLGAATSCFDGASYPAVQESWVKAPGTALILIKGFISVSGLMYPLLVVSLTQAGNWKMGIIIPLILSVLTFLIAIITPFSYDEEMKRRKTDPAAKAAYEKELAEKKHVLDADAKKAAARFKSTPPKFVVVGCAVYGFIAMATMYSAQQYIKAFGKVVVGMSDMSAAGLTSVYTAGSLIAVIVWGFFMAKLRWRTLKVLLIDLAGSVLGYGLVCIVRVPAMVYLATFMIGLFAAGGALQCGVSLMQEFHPGNKGRNLGIYYTFMGAASYAIPYIQSWLIGSSSEASATVSCLLLNLGMAVVGLFFMIYLSVNYKKWFGVSVMSKAGGDD